MWVRTIIPVSAFKDEAEMYKFLEKYIEFCDNYNKFNENSVNTFHFFLENCKGINDCLELRIEYANNWLCSRFPIWLLENYKDIHEKSKIDNEYHGEIEPYGEDGWQIAKKMFEQSCRVAVHIKTGKATGLFRETKFIHCFLDQCGYDAFKESEFYNMFAWRMLGKHIREKMK